MKTFFQELKRRRVYRVALAYVIFASATVQLVGTILPAFHVSDWIFQLLVFLLALGFPAALVLGWVFDLSRGGLRKTAVVAPPATDQRRLALLASAGLLIAALALGGYWFWQPARGSKPPPTVAVPLRLPGTAAAPPIPEKSIAVIPFANLSDAKDNSYFAEGVQDEILTDLAKVSDLKVISRTSVMQYRPGAERNIREIGRALGVAYILEGTVQRVGQRIRLSAQLIDARTDAHRWADHYDRNLSDLFALQSDLAETIVAQLRTKISPAEKAAIEETPTSDLTAHDLYVQANALISAPLFNVQGTENLFQAVALLDKAITRDPDYFLAYCLLASAHDQIFLNGPDRTPTRLALAEAAVQAAQRLRPDAGETHLARANHLYCGFLAYDDARRELALAARSLPNEPLIDQLAGFIDRRQGRWADSAKNLARALQLDPRNAYTLQQITITYQFQRQFQNAATALDQALRVLPTDPGLQVARAAIALHAQADSQPMHNAVARIVSEHPAAASGLADEWLFLALCERDLPAARRAIAVLPSDGYNNEGVLFPRSWCAALVARLEGNEAAAQTNFLQARAEIERSLQDDPNDSRALCVLGMIDAALGRKGAAITESRQAVQLLPISKDSINGALVAEYLAVTYTWLGEKEAALEQLREVAKIPSDLSYGQLKLHPFWDALRGDPEFEKIVAELAPK